MKSLPLLFLGIFFMLAFSFTGIVLTSHVQFGALEQTTESLEADENGNLVMPEGETLYPLIEGGLALQGNTFDQVLNVAFGGYTSETGVESVDDLLAHASKALEFAVEQGRDRVAGFNYKPPEETAAETAES